MRNLDVHGKNIIFELTAFLAGVNQRNNFFVNAVESVAKRELQETVNLYNAKLTKHLFFKQ